MRTGAKRYNNNYRKKLDVFRDTFLPRRSPGEIIQCSGCGAFYHRGRWTLNSPPGFSPSVRQHGVFCPGCQKLKAKLQKSEKTVIDLRCPKCPGHLVAYTFEGFALDRCDTCGGVWMDRGELEDVMHKVSRGPFGELLDRLTAKT